MSMNTGQGHLIITDAESLFFCGTSTLYIKRLDSYSGPNIRLRL